MAGWEVIVVTILIVVAVGVSVLETQNEAIDHYCLNATGHANWTAEECNLTTYNTCKPSGHPFGMTVCELKWRAEVISWNATALN